MYPSFLDEYAGKLYSCLSYCFCFHFSLRTYYLLFGRISISSKGSGSFDSYQWQQNGLNIIGATNSSYNATASGSYSLVVTNSCGNSATSNSISVTSNPTPKPKVTPTGPISICQGQTATLTANTANNITYQWIKNNSNIPGATNKTLVVNSAGTYKVKETNSVTGCTKTSVAVKVNVHAKNSLKVIY